MPRNVGQCQLLTQPRYGAIVRCELAGDRILAREQPIYGVE